MSATSIELPSWECLSLLGQTRIGRLCIIDGGTPIALPVNYRVDERTPTRRLVVRTAPSTTLARYEGACAVEADHIDLAAGRAWSVLVRGTVRRVVGHHQLLDPDPLVTTNRTQWLVIDITAISGRRFTVRIADDYTVDWQFA
jgi:nitroimidazol reductase NimA-like FMN-containing flavoprotein (pyridoxamine 5'-phosphate oxidase superfamily)